MSSFFLPLSRDVMMELVFVDEIEDLNYVIIDGKRYDPNQMFNPLAVFLLDCCMEQKRLIERDMVSDATKLNEIEFCSSKFIKEMF